jgi:hypothetical protein
MLVMDRGRREAVAGPAPNTTHEEWPPAPDVAWVRNPVRYTQLK